MPSLLPVRVTSVQPPATDSHSYGASSMYSPDAIEEHRREVPIRAPGERHNGGGEVSPWIGRNAIVCERECARDDFPGGDVQQILTATHPGRRRFKLTTRTSVN